MRGLLIAVALMLAGLVAFDFFAYQKLESMRGEMTALRQQVQRAETIAQEGSKAVAGASERAAEAASRAEIAAQGRQQAEAQKATAEQQKETATQQAREAHDQMSQMRREREEELNRMREALNRIAETRRTPDGMVMVLPNSIFRFEFDSAELSPKNRELLSRIAGILLVSKGYGLSVFGYTDDVGTPEYNQQLSLRRAKSVEEYLVKSGLDPGIVHVKGYGKSSPLVAGTSAENRAKNRRVELALTDTSIKFGGESDAKQ